MKFFTSTVLWLLTFTIVYSQSFECGFGFGGLAHERGTAICADNQGNVIAAGYFNSNISSPGTGGMSLTNIGAGDGYLIKMDPDGYLQWVTQIGSGGEDRIVSIASGPNDEVYCLGYYGGGMLHIGDDTTIYDAISFPGRDMFIVKLDADGNHAWSGIIEGNDDIRPSSIAVDDAGNVVCVGRYDDAGGVDFDITSGTFNLYGNGSSAGNYVFILKMDENGNFLWAKTLDNTMNCHLRDVTTDNNGNIICAGSYNGAVDVDPGSGVHTLSSTGFSLNPFLIKLNTNGDFLWAADADATNSIAYSCATDAVGNVYTYGTFGGTIDLDPGVDIANYTNSSGYSIFIQKLTPSGDYLWGGAIEATRIGEEAALQVDPSGNVFLTGSIPGSNVVDFNIGSGTYPGSGPGNFILRLTHSGTFSWVEVTDAETYALTVDQAGNAFLTGEFLSQADFNPSAHSYFIPHNGSNDAFVWKRPGDGRFPCANDCSQLDASISSTSATCIDMGAAWAEAFGGTEPYSYVWDTDTPVYGSNLADATQGVQTVTITDADSCVTYKSIWVAGPDAPNEIDMATYAIAGPFRPGFANYISVPAINHGCGSADGQLELVLPSFVNFSNASPPPSFIFGDTLVWDYTNVIDGPAITPSVTVVTPTNVSLGTNVQIDYSATPITTDINPTDNSGSYTDVVIGSYDPNDIRVIPSGNCDAGYIENEQELLYTIRFQNTGTASAVNITIIDTLDKHLDISTLNIITQSHEPMVVEIVDSSVLKFRFENIHLPDSNSNEPASHGYIIYSIVPTPGLPAGTPITNQAHIYFDFNAPITTNMVMNTIGEWPVDPTVNSVNDKLVAVQSNVDYQWYDCLNDTIVPGKTDRHFSPQQDGVYAVLLSDGGCLDTSACVPFNYCEKPMGTNVTVTDSTISITWAENPESVATQVQYKVKANQPGSVPDTETEVVTGEQANSFEFNPANCGFFYKARLRHSCETDNSRLSKWKKINIIPTSCQRKANDDLNIDIFPSPANEILNVSVISGASTGNCGIELFNLFGQKVYQWSGDINGSHLHEVNVKELSPGQYIIEVSQGVAKVKKQVIVLH